MKTVDIRCPYCRIMLKAGEINRGILTAWCDVCEKWWNWEKISPNAQDGVQPLAGGPGRNLGQSSGREANQKPIPGEKPSRWSGGRLRRRLRDAGERLGQPLKETHR